MSIPTESAPVPQSSAVALAREESSLSSPNTIPDYIQEFITGTPVFLIAKKYSVSRTTIYNWIHSEIADRDFPDIVRQAVVSRIAEADDALENASNSLDLARAREKRRFASWDAERRLKIFAPKPTDQGDKILVIVQREAAKETIPVAVTEAEFRVEK